MYNGDEKRAQANSAMRILINVQQQTHSCVKSLTKDVTRNSALTVANGVKLDTSIKYNIECDKRLKTVELWRAKHEGQGEGRDKMSSRIGTKITLGCTIGVFVIATLAFYFTSVKPTMDKAVSVYEKVIAIDKSRQEFLKH